MHSRQAIEYNDDDSGKSDGEYDEAAEAEERVDNAGLAPNQAFKSYSKIFANNLEALRRKLKRMQKMLEDL